MKTIFSIFLYVTKNNPIFAVPYRLFLAFIFQIYKHTTGGAFTIGLFNGKQAIVFPKCAISSQFVYASVPDKGEIDILRGLCDENTVFLDIGANVGAYSLMLCDKAVGGGVRL